jgi:hypothetical protein
MNAIGMSFGRICFALAVWTTISAGASFGVETHTSAHLSSGSSTADGSVLDKQLKLDSTDANDDPKPGPPMPVHNTTQGTFFATIQAAIDVADPDDMIVVGAGTFAENVTVSEDVTLSGANPADGVDAAEINGTMTVTADGATIENMRIVPGSVSGSVAGILTLGVSDVTLDGNVIESMTGDGTGSIKGIHVFADGPTADTNLQVLNNTISGIANPLSGGGGFRGAVGISVQGVLDGVDIQGNTIDDITSAGWAYGVEVTPTNAVPLSPPLDVEILQNAISSVNNGVVFGTDVLDDPGAAPFPGAAVSIDEGTSPADASEVTLAGNSLTLTPFGAINKDPSNTLDASGNWWGTNDSATIATSTASGLLGDVDFTPWLDNGTDTDGGTDGFQGDFSTLNVDDDSPQSGSGSRIDEAIGLVSGSTINVSPGTYAPFTLDESVTLNGAMAGVDARGRVVGAPDDSVESVISGAGILLTLETGCAGSTIDGFAFSGGTRAIESSSGPIDDLTIQNNHAEGQDVAVFLNDNGTDITMHQNVLIGTSSTVLHLDTNNFDGFHLTCNHIIRTGAASSTGWFVDGNRNVGTSGTRSPLISQNLFSNHAAGANIGRFALEDAEISDNVFDGNGFDGLQGGPKDSLLTGNTFTNNGRYGLAFTGFGGAGDPTRGAQGNTVTECEFSGNATADVLCTSGQFPGTIATNVFAGNSFGSAVGLSYAGDGTSDLIDASGNWWNSDTGPTVSNHPTGLGSMIDGAGDTLIDYTPWLDNGTDTDGGTDGFQGDFSTLNVDDDSPQKGFDGRIEEGVELVSASTVMVMPGTYVDADQVVVDKDVTIIGDLSDRPVLNISFDTGTSVVSQSDATLSKICRARRTLARMLSTLAVQMNAWAF